MFPQYLCRSRLDFVLEFLYQILQIYLKMQAWYSYQGIFLDLCMVLALICHLRPNVDSYDYDPMSVVPGDYYDDQYEPEEGNDIDDSVLMDLMQKQPRDIESLAHAPGNFDSSYLYTRGMRKRLK